VLDREAAAYWMPRLKRGMTQWLVDFTPLSNCAPRRSGAARFNTSLRFCSAQSRNGSTASASVAPSGVIEYSTVTGTVAIARLRINPSRSSDLRLAQHLLRDAFNGAP